MKHPIPLIAILCLLLTACVANQEVPSYQYLLPAPTAVKALKTERLETSVIRLKSVSVPQYLRKQNIILVDQQGQVFQAANHYWAEPLEQQLEGLTLRYLAKRLPQVQWFSVDQYQAASANLTVHLDAFSADPDGNVSVSGYWTLWSPNNQLLRQHRFSYEKPMTEEGYLVMNRTLSSIWFDHVIESVVAQIGSATP